MSIPVPKNAPIVLKQLWVMVLPDGTAHPAGASYHLSAESRDRMVAEVAGRLSTDMEGEREEPIGELTPIYTTPDYYQKIRASSSGLRVK